MRGRCESVPTPLLIALGGAVGVGARWAVDELAAATFWTAAPDAWPWPTLIVNVVGCALIGLAAAFLDPAGRAWSTLVTGGLGGFTTYSTFAVEANELADAGRRPVAVAYVAVTLLAGIAAAFLGARRATEPPVPRRSIE